MTALTDMRRGRLDFRVDRDAIVHAALGKVRLCVGASVNNRVPVLGALTCGRLD